MCWLVLCFCHFSCNRLGCSLLFCFYSTMLNGMYPCILNRVFTWSKAHGYCGVEFGERSEYVWALLLCWDNNQFRRVCVSILNRFSSNMSEEMVELGRVIDALGLNVRVVSVHGGPHTLMEAYINYLGSGHQQKLIEYPFFDLRLLKRCLQRTASSVFGTPDPYSKTELIVIRLKEAESLDWMAPWPALKTAIISSSVSLAMPELVDVVAKIVGVWPLIVPYLKETGRKDDGDILWYDFFLYIFFYRFVPKYFIFLMFRGRWWTGTSI